MPFGSVLMVHAVARREHKEPYFFSHFNFERMKEAGNTHFCFFCLSKQGFKIGPNGEILDSVEKDHGHYDGMRQHDPVTHAKAIIGNADKYHHPHEWLEKEMPEDFPCIIMVT